MTVIKIIMIIFYMCNYYTDDYLACKIAKMQCKLNVTAWN